MAVIFVKMGCYVRKIRDVLEGRDGQAERVVMFDEGVVGVG